jgi:low temperature requirement protein LtrA
VPEPARDEAVRVSTLELFFDLVFVFTITQLTTVLSDEATWRRLLQVVLMLGVIWWMYAGYAWLTNAVAPDRAIRRLILLAAMAGYLVLALSIPGAFGDDGPAFGIAYAFVVAVHTALFASTSDERVTRAVARLAPFNTITAGLVLAGGLAGGTAQYVLWTIAFLGEWGSGLIGGASEGFVVQPSHFVERHGLVVIVALGESVVAIGIGASAVPLDAELAGLVVLALLLSACLWFAYFGGDEDAAERALAAEPPEQRTWKAFLAFGVWHLPILLGIVTAAAGVKKAIGHPFDHLHSGQALALAGGVAIFMAGDALFRRTLAIGTGATRVAIGVAALATIPLGLEVSAGAQIAALSVLLTATLAAERFRDLGRLPGS